ncbi:MAG TPA: glycosyltransferase [Bacteroidota bacterium]|nr:glycosyltransferase [Bacteroidota bacterium]
MKKSLSLIVAVYGAVRYLEFVFAALRRQSLQDFEVIIADDGSGAEMKEMIERTRALAPFQIRHLWQEDEGFRKNVMLNRAIEAAQTDYLVFIDGDCVPHREFLHDHWTNRGDSAVLCGRRVNFSRQITDRLTVDDIASGGIEKLSPRLLIDGLLARSSNLEDAVRIENSFLRRLLHRDKARILGCNFSIERRLLERVNGFDEEYRAPGLGEDSDIAFRLSLVGARFRTLRYLAVLYHLYHPPTSVGPENVRLYERAVRSNNPVCANGLRKLEQMSPR